ncbi:MAG: PhzF family phenazine biosynthesis protein [Deltaproteobacteria bacterium]|nr:PhzF family phenazine biosynthesis protein [Deltaproteobacteria bacterium]
MPSFRYVLADVFADRPLAGNALAVFTDARGLDDERMQALARELNLSETVFVLPKQGEGQARIRIFTPLRELRFAGHPVLGAAFVIGTSVQLERIVLETAAGLVPVRLEREAARVAFGWMEQPLPRPVPFADAPALLAALHLESSELPVAAYDNGLRHVFVALPSPAAVAALRPDMAALARLPEVAVSTFAGRDTRWKTRMFAPAFGIAEDPATGSAAGPLAVHLARHGRVPYGSTIEIEQGAEIARPSRLLARAEGSAEGPSHVEVGGAAVIVARGEFRI